MKAMAGQAAGRGLWRGGGEGSGVVPVSSSKPAVLKLSPQELTRLLPWSGCASKLEKEVGDLERSTARVAVSLVACALVYGSSIELGSVAGFYWAWAPICSTLLPNLLLRLRYRYAGIWRAHVIDVQIVRPQTYIENEREGLLRRLLDRRPRTPSTLQLEIGDGSPATFKMQVPLTDEVPEVQAGEPVDIMVVSDKPLLSRFKALHDVYFPERRLWISENPCIERTLFEQLQESPSHPSQRQSRQGGVDGRRARLLLEENTLSRDNVKWQKTLRGDPQADTSRDLDSVMDIQDEKNDRRSLKRLDDADLYL